MSITSVHTDYEELTVTMVATFEAPIERVWDLWSDPRKLERWWGPPGLPATFEQHDLTRGAEVRYVMTGPEGDRYGGLWRITAVDPPVSLEFADLAADAGGTPIPDSPVSRVSVRLTNHERGTHMEIRSRFESREDLDKWLGTGTREGQQRAISQMDDLLDAPEQPEAAGARDHMHDRTPGGHPWLGLAVLALPTLLLSVDATVLYLALPSITTALKASPVEQLWILDIYSFVLAGFLVPMGSLGDRIGHRRLMLIGAAAFGAVSVIAAFAPSALVLILTRAGLGLAGATLGPTTLALIRALFPDPAQFGRAIGVWFACFVGGALIGPLIGGVVLETTWWGGVFLLGVPVMVLLLVLGPILLPTRPESAGRSRIDLVSTAIALGAVLPAIWGIKELARGGVAVAAFGAIAVGSTAGVVFVRRQLRLPEPMLDLRLFRAPAVGYGLGANLVTGIVMAGSSLLASLYLQTVVGLSPLRAALWLIPQNVAMIIGFQVGPVVAKRLSPLLVVAIGFGLAAVGIGLLGSVTPASGPLLVAVAMTVASFAITGPMTVLQTLIMTAAPPERAGSVAGVNETSSEFGIALGIALLGSLAAAVTGLARAGGNGAGPAFTAGYAVAEIVAAGAFVVLAVGALLLARRGNQTSDAEPAEAAEATA